MDPRSADWDAHEKACNERLPFRNFTYRRVDEGGQAHWIRISGEPVFDGDGVFKGYRGVGAEVTQERQADQEIVRLKDLYAAHDFLVRLALLCEDRKSTRLNSSHTVISYAVFCLTKKEPV